MECTPPPSYQTAVLEARRQQQPPRVQSHLPQQEVPRMRNETAHEAIRQVPRSRPVPQIPHHPIRAAHSSSHIEPRVSTSRAATQVITHVSRADPEQIQGQMGDHHKRECSSSIEEAPEPPAKRRQLLHPSGQPVNRQRSSYHARQSRPSEGEAGPSRITERTRENSPESPQEVDLEEQLRRIRRNLQERIADEQLLLDVVERQLRDLSEDNGKGKGKGKGKARARD